MILTPKKWEKIDGYEYVTDLSFSSQRDLTQG